MIGDTTIHEVTAIEVEAPNVLREGEPNWFESQRINVETEDGSRFTLVLIGQNGKPMPRIVALGKAGE